MQKIENQPSFPQGAQYAKLTKIGSAIQSFYKEAPVKFNDGTTEILLFYISDFNSWATSIYTIEELLSQKDGFEVVSIG